MMSTKPHVDRHKDQSQLMAKAKSTRSNEEMLHIAKTECNMRIVAALGTNPKLTADAQKTVLDRIYSKDHDRLRDQYDLFEIALADNPVASKESLHTIAFSGRSQLAKTGIIRRGDSVELQAILIKDHRVWLALSEAKELLPQVREVLLTSGNEKVRTAMRERQDAKDAALKGLKRAEPEQHQHRQPGFTLRAATAEN